MRYMLTRIGYVTIFKSEHINLENIFPQSPSSTTKHHHPIIIITIINDTIINNIIITIPPSSSPSLKRVSMSGGPCLTIISGLGRPGGGVKQRKFTKQTTKKSSSFGEHTRLKTTKHTSQANRFLGVWWR